ncbi:MAG: hypothetical protein JO242_28125 [Streptosporangiaceae bacterium]|nr:hypothetical protein [Streptosporangiaceae bacterium]
MRGGFTALVLTGRYVAGRSLNSLVAVGLPGPGTVCLVMDPTRAGSVFARHAGIDEDTGQLTAEQGRAEGLAVRPGVDLADCPGGDLTAGR